MPVYMRFYLGHVFDPPPSRRLPQASERAAEGAPQLGDIYFCSLSGRTVVYKGMLRSEGTGQGGGRGGV